MSRRSKQPRPWRSQHRAFFSSDHRCCRSSSLSSSQPPSSPSTSRWQPRDWCSQHHCRLELDQASRQWSKPRLQSNCGSLWFCSEHRMPPCVQHQVRCRTDQAPASLRQSYSGYMVVVSVTGTEQPVPSCKQHHRFWSGCQVRTASSPPNLQSNGLRVVVEGHARLWCRQHQARFPSDHWCCHSDLQSYGAGASQPRPWL
mmetsp:Transcript_22384/g.64334  ORF Transcript_22384/g.64334 Transcript_22384/m.64334 type:complete len:200 (+) Transcript_22384:1298-1897(+)